MKTILIAASVSSLIFLSACCETFVPIDPNTGKRGCNMMPDKVTSCCTSDPCAPCCSKVEVKPSK